MTSTPRHDNARVGPGEGAEQNSISAAILAEMAAEIKARLQAGETVAATDYLLEQRPAYWGAIAIVRDDIPAVKPSWRTVAEVHVDGRRLREKTFRLRAAGEVDPLLAAWMCVVAVALLLALRGWLI